MFAELDTIVLGHNIEEHKLRKGDIGTIVHIYNDKIAMEIEFLTAEGKTVAVLTLTPHDIRPIAKGEMLHVRGFAGV